MLTKSQKEISTSLEDIMDRSVEKIQKLKIKITSQIESFFFTFEIKFKEEFKREIQSFLQLSQQDLQTQIPKLKEQLLVKFEKLENMQQILSEFKVSPNFVPVDPLINLPKKISYTQFDEKQSASSDDNSGAFYFSKKIRKSKKLKQPHYQCPQCPLVYSIRIYFREHLSMTHNMILLYSCPHCEFLGNDYARLTPHLFDSHGKVEGNVDNKKVIKTYICKFTKKEFHSKAKLSFHIRDNLNYHRYE